MKFEELDGFRKDVKGLSKKYKSLQEDLLVVRKILMVMPDERPPFSFRLEDHGSDAQLIKISKIACKSIKGQGVHSGLHLLYAFFKKEQRIVMVGLYPHNIERSLEEKVLLRVA